MPPKKVINIFLEIEYLGTNYFGFQVQEKKGRIETVQAVLESALSRLFRKKIRINYASRTDRGVHARAQVINFKINTQIALKNIKKALNSFLPLDIRAKKIKRVPLEFHARFWAQSKIYNYIILNRRQPSVFWENLSWQIATPLDIEAMRKVSKKIIGKRDFSIFAKQAGKYRDCVRMIGDISIKKRNSFIYVSIEGNGFLRNMARNIVSFLVKVGSDRISSGQASLVLKKKIPYTNKPAPAKGLYLQRVNYK